MSETVSFQCEKCHIEISLEISQKGKYTNCSNCRGLILVPNGAKKAGLFSKAIGFFKVARSQGLSLKESLISSVSNGRYIDYKNDLEVKQREKLSKVPQQALDLRKHQKEQINKKLSENSQLFKALKRDAIEEILKSHPIEELIELDGIGKATVDKLKWGSVNNFHDLYKGNLRVDISGKQLQLLQDFTSNLQYECSQLKPKLDATNSLTKQLVENTNFKKNTKKFLTEKTDVLIDSLEAVVTEFPKIEFKDYANENLSGLELVKQKVDSFVLRLSQNSSSFEENDQYCDDISQDDYIQAITLLERFAPGNNTGDPTDKVMRQFVGKKQRIANTLDDNTSIKKSIKGSSKPQDKALIRSIESFMENDLNLNGLNCHLRQYQAFCAAFALVQKDVIVGDEMGLGKTIQALAVMNHLIQENPSARILIVVPASLRSNWQSELKPKGNLDAKIIIGNQNNSEAYKWNEAGGVLIISYTTLAANVAVGELLYHSNNQSSGTSKKIDLIVADEAHFVKNSYAKRSIVLESFLKISKHNLLMTGTPVENKPEEFFTLIDYLDHNYPPLRRPNWENLKFNADAFIQYSQYLYLRRTTNDVLFELPEKIESLEWMDANQSYLNDYDNYLKMRDKSDHFMACRNYLSREPTKVERIKNIINEAHFDNRKVILFTYFSETLQLFKSLYENTLEIHGKVSQDVRTENVKRFTESNVHNLLLCQVRAAGHGLNIQAASVVIIAEPQLNPAVEDQAIARAYRMGQRKNVMVYRAVLTDSFEEVIIGLLEKKRKYFEAFAEESNLKESSDLAIGTDEISNAYKQWRENANS